MKYHQSLNHSRTQDHTYTPGNQTNHPSALPGKVRYRHHWTTKALALLLAMLIPSPAWALESTALPDGGTISAGSGSISSSAANMTITQDSQNLAINWQNYNIGSSASVTYVQPSSSAVALNRVIGTGASEIYGKLNANGQVFLLNSNGILFGDNAQVNVGGLVASTLSLSDDDFMAGNYTFNGTAGSIVNQGTITSQYIALLGGQVSNQGTISAKLGKVILAAGETMTLDFAGDGLTSISIDEGTLNALAENKQLIMAEGGTVIMTAAAADSLIQAVVNNEGVIEANSVEDQSGTIVLLSDMDNGLTSVSGTLSATADDGDGGFIETSGEQVQIADDASITTLATNGTTGTWLIDPTDFTIESGTGAETTSSIGAKTLAANLETTNVEIQTDNSSGSDDGDINVNAAVSWDAATTLTLNAYNDININADISASSGTLKLYYGQGSSDGGSSSYSLNNDAAVSLAAGNHFYTKLGSDGTETEWTVITALGSSGSTTGSDLQGINGNLSGNYVLGSDIDASATASWNYDSESSTYLGFDPLGNSLFTFKGNFDGLGHTISNLTINRSEQYVGLFGYSVGSTISNLGLLDINIYGIAKVGGLAGWATGTINNSYVTGSITGSSTIGGLVGVSTGTIDNSYATDSVSGRSTLGGLAAISSGVITSSYATGTVTGSSTSGISVGGLVGESNGDISTSYATGSVSGYYRVGGLVGNSTGDISTSYATGAVTGSYFYLGGLVGITTGDISNSYTTGTVTGLSKYVGGLAGLTSGNISNSYATGNVTSSSDYVGGLVGWLKTGTIDDSYANGTVSGGDCVGGLVGRIYSGSVSSSHATGAITGSSEIGGLVGSSSGNIDTSYATGTVTGSSDTVGGLVGHSGKDISNSYASGNVTGGGVVGGLAGILYGTSSNSYATGSVTGTSLVGGLIGYLVGVTTNSYATGIVSGSSSYVGGLVGKTTGTISNSFWDTSTTGQNNGCGSGDCAGANGLTTTELQSLSSYSSWDISATGGDSTVWRIYDGYTYPLLRSFLTDLTITATSGTRTYDATTNGLGVSYSSTVDETLLFGDESVTASKDVGEQTVTSKLYSNQQGSDITTVDGTVTITPATLAVVGTSSASDKTYDGTTAATVNGGTISGILATDDVTLTQSGTFSDKNVGTGKTVTYTNTISGTDASNYVISSSGTTTADITAATLSLSGTTASDKVYDSTITATVSGSTITGIIGDDDVTLDQTATFADKNVGTDKTVTYSNSLSGSDAGNYVIASSGTTTADITAATLTVSGTTASDKTYDSTTTATVSGSTITGIIGDDDVTLDQTATFADKNVGTDKTVTYTNSLTGTDASNYVISSSGTTTADITAATLSLSGTTASDKVYDSTTTATVSGSTITGVIGGDDVTLDQTATFSNKNVGTDKTVTYSNSLSGTDAGNYVIVSSGTTTADITAATLTLSGTTASDKVYDSTTAATVNGSTITGIIGDDDVALDQTATFSDKNVGADKTVTYSNSLSGTDASNYVIVSSGTTTADITAATLTVSGTTASDKTYDSTTATTVSGSTITGIFGDDDVTLSQTATFSDKNVGTEKTVTYSNSISGSDAGNYVIASSGTTTADITAATLTVSDTTASDKTYDGTTVASLSDSTLSGVISDDDVSLVQTATFLDQNVGTDKTVTYVNSISGSDAGNYIITSSGTTTADITAAALTVTVNSDSKVYDGSSYSGGHGVSYSGFAAGEDTSVLTGELIYGGTAQGATDIGHYSLTATGLAADNYTINYIDSSLVISPNTGYEAALYYADTLHSLPTDSQQEENQDMIAHTTIIAGGIRLPADLAR